MRTIVTGATLALATLFIAPAAHADGTIVDKVIPVVKCVGDALGGNACHSG